ncbi:MAG TPA: hypothetical protein VHV51_19365 [Polyangiaceae bacterium]|nr:hypothetical protein [Polyangiaceae bacterium]
MPPEQEADQSFRAPVVSGRWVWTANPDTGKVAIIDAKTFGVRLADAGQAPTYLTALPTAPNQSRALVINAKSNDATLLSATDTGPITASSPIPLQPNANTWTVSASGHFAIAWTDTTGLMPDPAQAFQDISVVDLSTNTPLATRLVVGFLPSRVFVEDDEKMAFVVATSGISVIDLDGAAKPRVLREVPVSDNLNEDATTRDVSVLPDGSYALVRHDGSAIITLVKLADGTREEVTLPGPVTDLDLVSDAKSALAVVRGDPFAPTGAAGASGSDSDAGDGDASASDDAGTSNSDASASDAALADGSTAEGGAPNGSPANPSSTLAILPLPGIFSAPTSFQTISIDEIFGQVEIAPQGTEALLFTNAIANTHLTLLETAPGATFGEHRTIDVHGDVKDVFPSPDGAYAIASLVPNGTTGKPGFAVVPVGSTLPTHTQTTEAPVFAVAQTSSPAARAIITVSDDAANFAAYVVRMPELVVDRVSLPSRPLAGATGLVPDAGMAYIAESYPEGRITFIDLDTGVPRTITGFEIASKVVDGN